MTPARVLRLLAVTAALGACDHTQPFTASPPVDSGAFAAGDPARLTFNPGNDLAPAWLPGGRAFLYTQARPDRPDDDWCLAEMGDSGGTVRMQVCDDARAAADSQNTFLWFAADTLGRLAYLREATPLGFGALAPLFRDVMLGTLAAPLTARRLLRFPLTSPSGDTLYGAAELAWLGPDTLVFLGERVIYPGCGGSCVDTVHWGREIDVLDLAAPTPVLAVVPGTIGASSVALAGRDTLYFTRNGDTLLYRHVLGSAAIDTVFDFDTLGVARDVAAAGGALVAVAGGDVGFVTDPVFGTYPRDRGGFLYRVVLDSGRAIPIGDSTMLVRHPAVSPDGKTVVAEVPGAGVDLWRWAVPPP